MAMNRLERRTHDREPRPGERTKEHTRHPHREDHVVVARRWIGDRADERDGIGPEARADRDRHDERDERDDDHEPRSRAHWPDRYTMRPAVEGAAEAGLR